MLGVEPGESSRRCRPVFPINHQRRCAAHGVEDLLLVAAGLIVLGDLLAGRDVDEVHAERAQAEGPTHEPPGAARLAVVAVGEIEAHRSPFLSVGTGRVSRDPDDHAHPKAQIAPAAALVTSIGPTRTPIQISATVPSANPVGVSFDDPAIPSLSL